MIAISKIFAIFVIQKSQFMQNIRCAHLMPPYNIAGIICSFISLLQLRLKALSLLLISLFVIIGCDRHDCTRDNMQGAESLIMSRPDSALALLEGIEPKQLVNKKLKAKYALLKSIALDKNYVDTTTFDILRPAIDYYLEHGSPDEKLNTDYYQGRIYQNQGEYDKAMRSFINGRELAGLIHDTLTLANLMVAQATIQYRTYRFNDFIKNNLSSARLYASIGRTDYEVLNLCNVLDGSIITDNRILADSVLAVVRERISRNPEFNSILKPYELSYVLNFGKKNELLVTLSSLGSPDSLDDSARLDIAEAYRRIGDAPNARFYLNSINSTSNMTNSLRYLAIKSGVLELNGDLKGALSAYREYQSKIDSIHSEIFSNDLLFAEQRHAMEKSNMAKLQKRDRIIWMSLCATLIMLCIAGLFYHKYRFGKTKIRLKNQENQRLQLEYDNISNKNKILELESNNAKLECDRKGLVEENLRHKIKELEEESVSLKEALECQLNLSKPVQDAIKVRIEMLNRLLAFKITNNQTYAKDYEDWRDNLLKDRSSFLDSTRLAFKASHPNFIKYLESHSLSELEVNYACLYVIGLRGKEVGEYMESKRHYHISSDIRRKLGIDQHQENIGGYLRKLLRQL